MLAATVAWVIAIFSPDSRQPPGTGSATVRRPAASEPEPGSVTAMPDTASPAISGGMYCSRTARLPPSPSCAATRPLCTGAAATLTSP
jgi:hypothetical protein